MGARPAPWGSRAWQRGQSPGCCWPAVQESILQLAYGVCFPRPQPVFLPYFSGPWGLSSCSSNYSIWSPNRILPPCRLFARPVGANGAEANPSQSGRNVSVRGHGYVIWWLNGLGWEFPKLPILGSSLGHIGLITRQGSSHPRVAVSLRPLFPGLPSTLRGLGCFTFCDSLGWFLGTCI